MSDLEIEVSLGRIRAIPAVSLVSNAVLLSGPGELLGWSFRESGPESSLSGEGTFTSPGAGQGIASIPTVPAGVYNLAWQVSLAGTIAAAEANNFAVVNGFTVVEQSLNPAAAGLYPQDPIQITVPAAQTVFIKAVGAGTAASVYGAQLSITPAIVGQGILELRDGNQPLGEITAGTAGALSQWYGPEGIRFYNQIAALPVQGLVTGVVYARFGRARGYT